MKNNSLLAELFDFSGFQNQLCDAFGSGAFAIATAQLLVVIWVDLGFLLCGSEPYGPMAAIFISVLAFFEVAGKDMIASNARADCAWRDFVQKQCSYSVFSGVIVDIEPEDDAVFVRMKGCGVDELKQGRFRIQSQLASRLWWGRNIKLSGLIGRPVQVWFEPAGEHNEIVEFLPLKEVA